MSTTDGARRPEDELKPAEAEHSDDQDLDDEDGQADPPQIRTRDELYKTLGAVDDPEAEPEAETPPAGDPPAQPPKPEDKTAAKPEAPPAPTAPPAEPPPVADDPEVEIDAMGRVPDSEWKKLPKAAQDAITALRGTAKADRRKVKDLEPIAQYGKTVMDFVDANGLTDQEVEQWLGVAPVVAKGGQPAIDALLGMAKNLGWKGAEAPPPAATGKLPDWLQAKVDNLEVSPEAAEEIAAKLSPPAAPAKTEAPPADPALAEVHSGKQALSVAIAAAAKRFPPDQWAKIYPLVHAETKKRAGKAPPAAWAALFDTSLDIVLDRLKAQSAPPPQPQSLTPTHGSGGGKSDGDLKPRERLYKLARQQK
jgi:hypothetical protein